MKDEWRPAWYAVMHRYRLSTRKPLLVTVKHGRPMLEPNQHPLMDVTFVDWSSGSPHTVYRPGINKRGDGKTKLLVETWRSGLDPVWVDRGVSWLADRFQGQPELPLELLHAA